MQGTHHGWRLTALALAWLSGVALQLQERALMPAWCYLALGLLGLLCIVAAVRSARLFVAALLGLALLGFSVTGGRAAERLSDNLTLQLEGRDLVVTGVVASLPQRSSAGLRFSFDIEQASLGADVVTTLPASVSLGWYAGFHEDAALTQPQRELRAGQRWRFTVRLRQPHGNLNPHGFDHELHLFEQGVRATGYVRDAPSARLVDLRDAPGAELLQRAAGFPIERVPPTSPTP